MRNFLFNLAIAILIKISFIFSSFVMASNCPETFVTMTPQERARIESLRKILLDQIVLPVLHESGKMGYHDIGYSLPVGNIGAIDITSEYGDYVVELTRGNTPSEESLSTTVGSFKTEAFGTDIRMRQTVRFQEQWLEGSKLEELKQSMRGVVRNMFGGDPSIHPHIRSPKVSNRDPSTLSYPQIATFEKALEYLDDYRLKNPNSPGRVGIAGSTGYGKTTIAARIAGHVTSSQKRKRLIIFVVQSVDINNDAIPTFIREIGLSDQALWSFYGKKKQKVPPFGADNVELLVTTRTGMLELINDQRLAALIGQGDQKRKVVTIFDEAQDIPATDGEYQEIMAFFQGLRGPRSGTTYPPIMDPQDTIMMMSATMTHSRNAGLTSDEHLLDGNVVGPFLTDAELARLGQGDIATALELSLTQLRRQMLEGYATPLVAVNVVTIKDPSGASVLNKTVTETIVSEDGSLKKIVHPEVEPNLIVATLERMKADQALNPHLPIRAIVYVDGAARAHLWAKMLNQYAPTIDGLQKVVAIADTSINQSKKEREKHGLDPDLSFAEKYPVEFLNDAEVFRVSSKGFMENIWSFDTNAEKNQIKIVVVDKKLGRGADTRKVNTIVIAHDVDITQPFEVIDLIQKIGRSLRRSIYKSYSVLADLTGGSVANLFKSALNIQVNSKKKSTTTKKSGGTGGVAIEGDGNTVDRGSLLHELLGIYDGQKTIYGSDISHVDLFILNRSVREFDHSIVEGSQSARMILDLVREFHLLDKSNMSIEDFKYFGSIGLIDLARKYEGLSDRVKTLIESTLEFDRMVESGEFLAYAGGDVVLAEQLKAEEAAAIRNLSNQNSKGAVLEFWQSARDFLFNLDPMKNREMILKISPRHHADLTSAESIINIYTQITSPSGKGFAVNGNMLTSTVISRNGGTAEIKIQGEYVWPFFYREAGKHIFNAMRVGSGDKLHSREVSIGIRSANDEVLLERLPDIAKAHVNSTVTSGSIPNMHAVRNYNLRFKEITSGQGDITTALLKVGATHANGSKETLTLDQNQVSEFMKIPNRAAYSYLESFLLQVQQRLAQHIEKNQPAKE